MKMYGDLLKKESVRAPFDPEALKKLRQICWICHGNFTGTGFIHSVELESPIEWKVCPQCLTGFGLNCLTAMVRLKNHPRQAPEHIIFRLLDLLKAALEGHVVS